MKKEIKKDIDLWTSHIGGVKPTARLSLADTLMQKPSSFTLDKTMAEGMDITLGRFETFDSTKLK